MKIHKLHTDGPLLPVNYRLMNVQDLWIFKKKTGEITVRVTIGNNALPLSNASCARKFPHFKTC